MNVSGNPQPLICLITRGVMTPENFEFESEKTLNLIRKAVEQKIQLIQIREKRLPTKLLFEFAAAAVALAAMTETKILINDRFDVALAVAAGGVQLTGVSIPTEVVRANTPSDFVIGVSCHSLAEAERARRQHADFVLYSPIFNTPNKPPPKGLENLNSVCRRLDPFPVLALGGINEENYESVLAAGAAGFAGIGFLNDEDNIVKIAQKIL